jgi:hypothetical protein
MCTAQKVLIFSGDQGPTGHLGDDDGVSVNGDQTQHGKTMR